MHAAPALSRWDYLQQTLRLAAVFLLLSLLLFAIARGWWIASYGNPTHWQDLNTLLQVFWQGMRFDAKTAAVVLLLPLLLAQFGCWIPRKSHTGLRILRWSLFLLLWLMLLIVMINHFYYRNFQNHIDIFIFGLIEDDTWAVLQTVYQSYPWFSGSVVLIFIAVLLYALLKRLGGTVKLRQLSRPRWQMLGSISLFWMMVFVLARGSLGLFPLSPDTHLAVSADPFLNRSVLNGVFAFYDAWENHRDRRHLATVHDNQAQRAYAALHQADPLRYPHENFDPQQPNKALIRRTRLLPPVPDPLPHVIVVLMESFGSWLLHFHSINNNLLGSLESHFAADYLFRHFVSAGLGTYSSLEKLVLGLPSMNATTSALRTMPFPTAMARIFRSQGYRSIYLTSGNKTWHDVDLLLPHQGFDELRDRIDITAMIPHAEHDGTWGVFDEYAYDYVLHRLHQAKQPLFFFILTTSNHSPYTLPQDYTPQTTQISPELADRLIEHDWDQAHQVLQSFQYANDALGRFLQAIKADDGLRERTLIAATGDHHTRDILRYDGAPQERGFRYLVPFYLYLPEFYRQHTIKDLQRPGSHWDILPTLLERIFPQLPYLAWGHDLLAVDFPPYAMGVSEKFLLHQDGAVMDEQYFIWQDRAQQTLQSSEPSPKLKKAAEIHRARWLLLQWWLYRYEQSGGV